MTSSPGPHHLPLVVVDSGSGSRRIDDDGEQQEGLAPGPSSSSSLSLLKDQGGSAATAVPENRTSKGAAATANESRPHHHHHHHRGGADGDRPQRLVEVGGPAPAPSSSRPPAAVTSSSSSATNLTRTQSLPEPSSAASEPSQHGGSSSFASPQGGSSALAMRTDREATPNPATALSAPQEALGADVEDTALSAGQPHRGGGTDTTEVNGAAGGTTRGSENGGHVLERKGRFTLLKPAHSSSAAVASAATVTPTETFDTDGTAQPALPTTSAAAGAAVAAQEEVAAAATPAFPADGAGPSQPPAIATATATLPSNPPAAPAIKGTKKKGRFTLMQETTTTAAAPAVMIVVDRAPLPPPPSSIHHPADQERGMSQVSTAMSSLSASVGAAAFDPVAPPPTTTTSAAAAAVPAVTTIIPAAPSAAASSTSSAPTVKKVGRFVVSSVVNDGLDPQSAAAAGQPTPAAQIPPATHQQSAVLDPVVAQGSVPPTAHGLQQDIPREVVAVVDHPTSAVPASVPHPHPATLPAAGTHPHPAPLHPTPPSLPPQPILYALVPTPVPFPIQPVPNGSVGASEPPHVSAVNSAAPLPAAASHATIGSAIRPTLSSNNLAATDATGQESYISHVPAPIAPPHIVPPSHAPAPLPARESSSSVPVQPSAHEALLAPSSSRSKDLPSTAATANSATHPSASASGGGTATSRNSSAYAGRHGVGKMFHYLDQLRLEATDAELTIKNLLTDVRLLKEKNKELEATARDTERKLIEERKLREAVEYKLKQAKKKLRDLTQAPSQPREDHTKSASTSYDSLGIAASLSGEYRDDRMTIEPSSDSFAASAPPLSPPFAKRADHAHTPTRDYNPALGEVGYPLHCSPSASAAAVPAKGILNGQPPVEPGRQSAGNSPRTARVLLNSSKLPPLPTSGAPQVGTSNVGSGRTPNERPPLGSSARGDIQYPSQNGPAATNRSLAVEFDPMRPAHRERLPSGDSMSDLPEITSQPGAHAALPNPVHPVSPTQRLASRTYHGVRDLHQQFHLQQPALDNASAVPTLHPSSSFSEFRHMVLVPQQVDAAHGSSPIVFAFPSSYAPNGNHQWIPVAVHDPMAYVAQPSASAPVPEPDPFDEIVRRTSNPG